VSVGSVTFRYFPSRLSWADSQASCASIGSGWDLATIASLEENTAATQLVGDNVWIGFNDELQQGTFNWASGAASTYTSWSWGEPNMFGVERHTFLKGKTDLEFGRWNNLQGSNTLQYLCSVRFCDSLLIQSKRVQFKIHACMLVLTSPYQYKHTYQPLY
jgi:hypothetical protein